MNRDVEMEPRQPDPRDEGEAGCGPDHSTATGGEVAGWFDYRQHRALDALVQGLCYGSDGKVVSVEDDVVVRVLSYAKGLSS